MKKILNILIVITTIILVSSCIPTGGGGTVTPSNTIAINLTLPTKGTNLQSFYSKEKIIYVDGDSILISMTTTTDGLTTPQSSINILPLTNIHTYEFIQGTNAIYYNANVTFSDTSNYNWINIPASGIYLFGATILLHPYGMYGIVNQDKFIVFRKSTTNGNKYFWLKFRENSIVLAGDLTIYNVKYQMNSIITGY
ncbi:MAG: hypothetical protein H6553_02230 [Chitinophagales bacterium]|nr:hypothetical protein [Chitinophagales bacterium]